MDMSAAYTEEVRFHCPNAQIVYDLFHVPTAGRSEFGTTAPSDSIARERQVRPFLKAT